MSAVCALPTYHYLAQSEGATAAVTLKLMSRDIEKNGQGGGTMSIDEAIGARIAGNIPVRPHPVQMTVCGQFAGSIAVTATRELFCVKDPPARGCVRHLAVVDSASLPLQSTWRTAWG